MPRQAGGRGPEGAQQKLAVYVTCYKGDVLLKQALADETVTDRNHASMSVVLISRVRVAHTGRNSAPWRALLEIFRNARFVRPDQEAGSEPAPSMLSLTAH